MIDAKPWYQSKGLAWAALTIVVGIASAFGFAQYSPDPATQQVMSAIILVIVGAVNAYLRTITTEAIA